MYVWAIWKGSFAPSGKDLLFRDGKGESFSAKETHAWNRSSADKDLSIIDLQEICIIYIRKLYFSFLLFCFCKQKLMLSTTAILQFNLVKKKKKKAQNSYFQVRYTQLLIRSSPTLIKKQGYWSQGYSPVTPSVFDMKRWYRICARSAPRQSARPNGTMGKIFKANADS